ncbi:MAG TPA: acyl CoA:acetate/3-ketoacid CoA transferase, partial [Desulfomonilia bacterium]|nr:acyl CoA:acetate/3-ketoacid CoA transferase [Desulfomonilia bacterium]
VEQVTFSGRYALMKGQPVFYITERCVFSLGRDGLELIEVAPGIDIESDILAHMGFTPVIRARPLTMDERIFRPIRMALLDDMTELSLTERLTYDPVENLFFVNFEGYKVRNIQDIQEIENMVTRICSPLQRKVYTIVNYDNFDILPELVDDYTAMVRRVVKKYYSGVTRYTTNTFLRMKLGEALNKRRLAPHIYETGEEARQALRRT